MTPPSCYIMLPQYRLEKLAGMSMLAGASTWITHNTKFQSKAGYLGPRGGYPVQVNCQFWQLCTSFKALCTTRWTRFGYINIIRNQWGWIPWQHQQWPTILDNQEVNPIWIRAHPIICDYVGRSLSSSGNMINSHGSLGQSSYRMIHDHLHGSLRHSAIFWHGPMLPNTIPSAAMAWIPGASLPLTPLEQLETTKSCWTDTFLSMWPGVT